MPWVLRATTSDDLKAYLAGPQPAETAWLSPERQHEEAWFLGLRLNAGVAIAALEREFGSAMVAPALETAKRLAADGLLSCDGEHRAPDGAGTDAVERCVSGVSGCGCVTNQSPTARFAARSAGRSTRKTSSASPCSASFISAVMIGLGACPLERAKDGSPRRKPGGKRANRGGSPARGVRKLAAYQKQNPQFQRPNASAPSPAASPDPCAA